MQRKSTPLSDSVNSVTPRAAHRRAEFARRLAAACAGRAAHADLFSITATKSRWGTSILWEDAATGERGWIGSLDPDEVVPVVDLLFTQLRTWRERCAALAAPAKAKAKGVGA